ncbi:VOC family protein [Actinomadura sp. NEAU-AAG7]|uniref:VOC family protein n=1 Tax=Actinomadura sp. NEAU-AAG7 TaxID=2839640 RepID=UPI001BE3D75E|nr:VOC family protein [Actinomadura sp. NEAU-AAG7]MBT2209047.1 VOC family protein [Actinomadura sp. NEAU-AAG7]
MPEVTEYAHGAPCWADLATPDLGVSMGFYRALFGWGSYTLTIAATGDYEVFTHGGPEGPTVSGMQPLADDTEPPSWTCYVHTDDLDRTFRAVLDAGGTALVEPVTVANLGRMAVCVDSQGADFGIYQSYDHRGADVMDETDALCWIELWCRDTEAAKRFYGAVFGWTGADRGFDRWNVADRVYRPSVYTDWLLGDRPLAGMLPMDGSSQAHWIPYFWVTDCDSATGEAVDLGAVTEIPPNDAVHGRFSVVADPTGARLGLFTPSEAVRESVRARS